MTLVTGEVGKLCQEVVRRRGMQELAETSPLTSPILD